MNKVKLPEVAPMAPSRKVLELDLYFDETGRFLESSTVPSERNRASKDQKFPSLLAGFLVPRGDIQADAQSIIAACKEASGLRPLEGFKGSTMPPRQSARFVKQLVAEFRKRPDWEPVRIVNQEAVAYGDRVAAYTNIFAELILRILQKKSIEEPGANISIRAFGTTLMRNEGSTPTERREYLSRVFEYLKFLAVRRGLAVESNRWALTELVLNFGRERPELLIADVLSNASHDDFRKLDYPKPRRRSPTSELLIRAFGDRNWTLAVRELFERVSLLAEEYSFGMALIAIAETLVGEVSVEDYDPDFIVRAEGKVADINRRLAQMGARGRDPQLAIVLNWLDQIVGHQRLAARGYGLAQWLLANVAQPLRELLDDEKERETVDWFEYGLRRWALTAANHQGKLLEAAAEARAMRAIAWRLARQWERAPILFDGLIAQSVHLTDTLEFDRVSNDMRLVAQAMETQADLFSNYHAGEYPYPIKFDLRAKAIGTLIQNEMFHCITSDECLNAIRGLSDLAIEEFVDPKDKARQYQYRCHLETIACDFVSARRYLVRSMRDAQTDDIDISHLAIRQLLSGAMENPKWNHDFTVSHWLRLGARICLREDAEREDFLRAFNDSNLLRFYLELSSLTGHPIHHILRSLAIIQASQQEFGSALAVLHRLHELDPIGKTQFNFAVVMFACQIEIAGLIWGDDRAGAESLLDNTSGPVEGLRGLLGRIRATRVAEFPRIAQLVDSWEAKIDSLVSTDVTPANAKQILLEIGGTVRS